jgi:hypothetical protein
MSKLTARRRFYPMEAQWAIGMFDVHPVEEQHVEVDIEAIPGILPFTPSGPAFGCSKSLPAILSARCRVAGSG